MCDYYFPHTHPFGRWFAGVWDEVEPTKKIVIMKNDNCKTKEKEATKGCGTGTKPTTEKQPDSKGCGCGCGPKK